MLKIDVRDLHSGGYVQVIVKANDTTIDVGLLNKSERLSLSKHLKDVIYDLEYRIVKDNEEDKDDDDI